MPSPLWRPLLGGLVALLVAACDPFSAPESMLDEYVTRLARVLDVDARFSPVPVAPEMPRRRQRLRDVPALNVSMLEFLSLYGCELQHVVAQRNSALGRVMHPVNTLDYEVRFIRAAEACVEEIERESLVARIEEVTALKRGTLPDVSWNAIWGSREIENLFTRSRGPVGVDHDPNLTSVVAQDLNALHAMVERILRGDLEVEVLALDPVYQRWQSRPLMGQAVHSALMLTARLNDAAALIEARLGDRPLCRKQMRTRQAEIMGNMFVSVYATHVQRYMAEVQRVRHNLLPPLQSLAAIGDPSASPAFAAYAEHVVFERGENSHWRALDRAVERHTRAWQELLKQCGMRPGEML